MKRISTVWLVWCAVALACGSSGDSTADGTASLLADARVAPLCEPVAQAPEPLPGVEEKHLTLAYWLGQLAKVHDLDEELLTPEDIDALNAGLALPREDYHAPRDLRVAPDPAELRVKLGERHAFMHKAFAAGEYVHADGRAFSAEEMAALSMEAKGLPETLVPELRVALKDVQIQCAPTTEVLLSALPALDPRLDRNACSVVRAQDVLLVLASWPNGMTLVHSRYSLGWIPADAALSPKVPEELAAAFAVEPRLRVISEALRVAREKGTPNGRDVIIPAGTLLASADARGRSAHVATEDGFVTTERDSARLLQSTRRSLTRRAFLEEAWRSLGLPYGLGDAQGGIDCSRLVLDALAGFDIRMPRHSGWQARAGSYWIDVSKVAENERLLLMDAASKKGIVLLSFPGHIMVYLGRNDRDEPMALHALRQYMEPCALGGPDVIVQIPSASVSTLELGRGTERKALIERVTTITVLGKPPGVELGGVAELRPVPEAVIPADKQCRDSRRAALYVSPSRPLKGEPVRVIAVLSEDPGPAAFTFVGPGGERVAPEVVRLGGPPYGFVATVRAPEAGKWKAVLADGERLIACERLRVSARPSEALPASDGPIWLPSRAWNATTENLYALFVERLFDYPLADDQVWPNLHTLLRNPDHNILYNHLGLGEDELLVLQPDCADLPYTLRAYFAWKMRLPFGYRRCSRARNGRPPECDQPGSDDNLMSRLELRDDRGQSLLPRDDVSAFSLFVTTRISRAVHSSSGRTHPQDDLTDFYPVALTRESLRPGTLFADPYGHLLVLVDWLPQGTDTYGILIGADAQPDGTVGRRRFWRGSFLFDPDFDSGGAGFKAYRPRLFVQGPVEVTVETEETGPVVVQRVGYTQEVINEDLVKTRLYPRHSMQQYQRSADEFYGAMEALINPRPLEARTMQLALVDALEESVVRRVTSVQVGEEFMARHGAAIEMPDDAAIFLTEGPWEDYATPSRDLRLLISIDSVIEFPQVVRSAPERFGVRPEELDARVKEIEALLESELVRRKFAYTRSDGSTTELTLKDVVLRSERFEMAYNPNDCVEIRWGAAPGSAEEATCRRKADAEQRARMESYRPWFSSRKRPPR